MSIGNRARAVFGVAILFAVLVPHRAAATVPTVRAAIRQDVLARVNADRRAAGLPAVRLDAALSATADAYCERQLVERTVGHFTTDGLPPYARYSQAGVNDGTLENAVAWSAPYAFGAPAALDLARRSHAAMMDETPPRDSHRRAILDPHATHVGIGSAWSGGEFRLVQIFARRLIEWTNAPPRSAREGERLRAAGRALAGWEIAGASIHWEPLPRQLSREHANRIETYALPPPPREYQPRRPSPRPAEKRTLSGWIASGAAGGELVTPGARSFSLTAPLDRGNGIYTLVVWVRANANAAPIEATHISTIVSDAPGAGTNDALAGR